MMTELAMAERSMRRGTRDVIEAQANYAASVARYGGNRVLWDKLVHAEKIAAQRRRRYHELAQKMH
jgi:hypothetical protein